MYEFKIFVNGKKKRSGVSKTYFPLMTDAIKNLECYKKEGKIKFVFEEK